jgi:glutathione S-transferase
MPPVPELTLAVGDRSFSSWSLRGWLILKHVGVPFAEIDVALRQSTTDEEARRHSPSGRVPCLLHGDVTVWDSLAIGEYMHELFPDAHLLPEPRAARAHARSIVAEMHSGFPALRNPWSFDIAREHEVALDAEGRDDVARVLEIWGDCLERYGGPFLFGRYSLADIFYAPVVSRFRTYGLGGVPRPTAEYMQRIWDLPAMQEWVAAAQQEIAGRGPGQGRGDSPRLSGPGGSR